MNLGLIPLMGNEVARKTVFFIFSGLCLLSLPIITQFLKARRKVEADLPEVNEERDKLQDLEKVLKAKADANYEIE